MRILSGLMLLFLVGCNDGNFSVKLADPAPIIESDPYQSGCIGKTPGDSCGGGKYAGEVSGKHLVATPGGCDGSATPICDGTIDTYGDDMNWDGGITNRHAVYYCSELVLNGFDDWYLPQNWELAQVYLNKDRLADLIQLG